VTSLRHAWRVMGVHGRIAVGAAALALGVAAFQARHLVGASMAPAARASAGSGEDRQRGMQYAASVDTMVRHVDGRSLFFVPSPPPPPRPPDPSPVIERDPGPPPPPSRYGGPSIIAMMNDTVWFEDGNRLRAGESNGTVRLVRMDPPWGARVEWRGVEFDVGLFERDKVVMPERPREAAPEIEASGDPPGSRINATDSPSGEEDQEARQE
jgi:hypothetical protein